MGICVEKLNRLTSTTTAQKFYCKYHSCKTILIQVISAPLKDWHGCHPKKKNVLDRVRKILTVTLKWTFSRTLKTNKTCCLMNIDI